MALNSDDLLQSAPHSTWVREILPRLLILDQGSLLQGLLRVDESGHPEARHHILSNLQEDEEAELGSGIRVPSAVCGNPEKFIHVVYFKSGDPNTVDPNYHLNSRQVRVQYSIVCYSDARHYRTRPLNSRQVFRPPFYYSTGIQTPHLNYKLYIIKQLNNGGLDNQTTFENIHILRDFHGINPSHLINLTTWFSLPSGNA